MCAYFLREQKNKLCQIGYVNSLWSLRYCKTKLHFIAQLGLIINVVSCLAPKKIVNIYIYRKRHTHDFVSILSKICVYDLNNT
jgi:hypothetical protein